MAVFGDYNTLGNTGNFPCAQDSKEILKESKWFDKNPLIDYAFSVDEDSNESIQV